MVGRQKKWCCQCGAPARVSAISNDASFQRINQALAVTEEPVEPWVLNQDVDVQC